ncbi:hypothetical protein J7U46_19705 [Pelomonas sp. V22]|uniref:hypothetical protein n=1 Tax=Pelomonas sp. V22 TaxID=2822139 RepID=UPI0024A86F54|nr:hypothetical protein [Pelomonas sp. V22]MDI4635298.1 hypothetical protein [Pelomonas sp. V22]
MIFLVEYDRSSSSLIRCEPFADLHRAQAEKARLDLELQLLSQGILREVVILEAADEQGLRRTHGRYFESLPRILTAELVETATASDSCDAVVTRAAH